MANLPEKPRILFTRRFVRALSAVFCGLVVVAAVFFSRRPVVLVTDSAFTALYGEQRTMMKKIRLSALFFRQVKTAFVTESAGPDLVSLAARMASARPYAVFFPYRYRDGALRYIGDYPDASVAVLAGREKTLETASPGPAVSAGAPGGLAWYSTDTLTDFYRGGFCAGLLAVSSGEILVQAGTVSAEQRSALLQGVEESAGPRAVSRVRFTNGDFPEEAACAVVAGGGEVFFKREPAVPFILYSWLDPAIVPAEAAVIFSDSPWETVPEALKLLEKGQFQGIIPSVPWVSGSKTAGISAGQIKRLNFSPGIGDN
ncbi:MAG: hypothetical protein LBG26_04385 [Treponema sp.]|jgi:hypothetical protein|nr:hypothetical protein [Treponema sp.]